MTSVFCVIARGGGGVGLKVYERFFFFFLTRPFTKLQQFPNVRVTSNTKREGGERKKKKKSPAAKMKRE